MNYNKDLIIQACNFIKQRFQDSVIDSKIFKNTYFEKYLRTAASENLFGAAISIFRRYFRSSSLSTLRSTK